MGKVTRCRICGNLIAWIFPLHFCKPMEEVMALLTRADVFELIEPVDPDSIITEPNNEFLLNWIGGYSDQDGATLRSNEKIEVMAGPYMPEGQRAITHQFR